MNPHVKLLLGLGLLLAVFLLAACAAPAKVEYRDVKVPVTVPCLTGKAERPAYETEHDTRQLTDGDLILATLRDWVASRKYEKQLEARVAGCDYIK